MEVIVKDKTFSGEVLDEIVLKIEKDIITVRDVIEHRVLKEVEFYNKEGKEVFKGLIQPSNSEKILNGYKLKERKSIDAEKQVYLALDAYTKNGFFVLINDKQADSLETELLIDNANEVSFIKLTPLVGG